MFFLAVLLFTVSFFCLPLVWPGIDLVARFILSVLITVIGSMVILVLDVIFRDLLRTRHDEPRPPERDEPPPRVPQYRRPYTTADLSDEPAELPTTESDYRPLRVSDLTLVISRGGVLTKGKWVNTRQDREIRPVVVIEVFDRTKAGLVLPVSMKILDPRRRVRYEFETNHRLTPGTNYIYPASANDCLSLRRNTAQGEWRIKFYASGVLLSETTLTMSNVDIIDIARDSISPDMEITADDRRTARQFENLSIDDVLDP